MDTHQIKRFEKSSWQPFIIIIAASALAHLWCLGSCFYMDDRTLLLSREAIIQGQFWHAGADAWTHLWYAIQFRLFGISGPGFHLFNWLIHTGVACVLFGFGRELLINRHQWRVALFAAVLFAVHPLGSEIPNYTRTQDLAWVTLFSLGAAWFTLRFVRGGHWKNLVWAILATTGAALSKGPGLAHALMMSGVVGLAFIRPEFQNYILKHRRIALSLLVIAMGCVWIASTHWYHFHPLEMMQEPRFIGHAYTLSRVFWQFTWRCFIPVSLCSDHHIAETLVRPCDHFWNISDHGAILAALAFLALTGFSVFLTLRHSTRIFGVCLLLYVGSILFRVLYVIPEFMPEYRIYPSLPWFCLGIAVASNAALKKYSKRSLCIPVTLVIVCFTVLSAQRSFVWHSLDHLLENVLVQYPTQARALWELDDRDLAEKNWQAIIQRQQTTWPVVFRRFLEANDQLRPARELPTGHLALADVCCRGSYAVAIAHTVSPAAGLREIKNLASYMQSLGINRTTHALHWGYYYYYKAMALDVAGERQQAVILLNTQNVPLVGKDLLMHLLPPRAIHH